MSNKLTYPDSNAFSLVASDLRSLWVAGLTYGLHDSEETIKKKQLFADEIRQLLVIISGKDRSYLLWQPRIWTDWEYQEKVIFSFFAGNEAVIKKVLKKVKTYRLPCVCVDTSSIQQPCQSPYCINSTKTGSQK